MSELNSVEKLVSMLTMLPSVGKKTAARYAYRIINMSGEQANALIDSIREVKEKVHFCSVCGNFTDKEICDLCETRDKSVICVVKEPKDVTALERMGTYKGVYHVLHGTLDPLMGIGPDNIRISELMRRLDGVKEVIIATKTDASGEATAQYIARLIKPMGITVTRIGSGLPVNSDIEYADEMTLARAMADRKAI